MNVAVNPDRRGVLFEMLRRQNISDLSKRRNTAKQQDVIDAAERKAFLMLALRSWDLPRTFTDPDGVADAPELAPEPGRDHEFFRTVRP